MNLAEKLEALEGNRQRKLESVLKQFGLFREKAHRSGKVYGNKPPPDLRLGSGFSSKHDLFGLYRDYKIVF